MYGIQGKSPLAKQNKQNGDLPPSRYLCFLQDFVPSLIPEGFSYIVKLLFGDIQSSAEAKIFAYSFSDCKHRDMCRVFEQSQIDEIMKIYR